jgi:hypothetical protein
MMAGTKRGRRARGLCVRELAPFGFAALQLATVACHGGEASPAPTTKLACEGTAPFVVVPARPAIDAGAATANVRWFAFDSIRVGSANSCAWAAFGLDLDHRQTGATSADAETCKRSPQAPAEVATDGPGGVDDSFGSHVLVGLRAFSSCLGDEAPDATYTLLLRVDASSDVDAVGITGALFLGRDLGHVPHRDAGDRWLVDPASLGARASLSEPVVRFPDGYVRDGIWVSGVASGQALLPLFPGHSGSACVPERAREIDVPISSPRIVARLDGSGGVLAGVVPVAGLSSALAPVLASFGLCPGSGTYNGLLDTLTLWADVSAGAPDFQDPSSTCDAISLGVGFTMRPAGEPAGVSTSTSTAPVPSGCDGGVDAEAGGGGADAADGG